MEELCNKRFHVHLNNSIFFCATGAVSSSFDRYNTESDNLDRGSSDASKARFHSFENTFPKNGVTLNKVKREAPIDDVVGSASSRVTSTLDDVDVGGARGKRSERDNFKSNASMDGLKSERKTKAKSKHKNNHTSSSGNGVNGRFNGNGSNTTGREVGSSPPDDFHQKSSKEAETPVDFANEQLPELDSAGLGQNNDIEFNGQQDFDSWLNIEVDPLQDHDFNDDIFDIPMDDLSFMQM